MTPREQGIDLAGRVLVYLRTRLEATLARAEQGRATANQVREATLACESAARAVRNLKRRRAA